MTEQPVGYLADPVKLNIEDEASQDSFYRGDSDYVDRCNFIWRPVNYPDRETQRRIDRRLIRQSPMQALVYNHFEQLRQIATKSGLVKSLKQYYYTN